MPSQFRSRGRTFVLFPGALGDFLCFAPALPELRRRSSGAVVVVARPQWTNLLDARLFGRDSIDGAALAEIFGEGALHGAERLFTGVDEIYSFTGAGDENFARRLRSLA